jgi:hypothetical protein
MANTEIISSLLTRQDTWRGRNLRLPRRTLGTGHNSLDLLLQGGWPTAALTELLPRRLGIGELSLLLPIVKEQSSSNQLCLWLDPPYQPYAPRLAAAGIALDRLLIVRSKNPTEWLWVAEQSIRNGALLLAWSGEQRLRYTDLRKLQLAAADSSRAAFLFSSIKTLTDPSPAALRLELDSQSVNQLQLTVRKLRGTAPGDRLELNLDHNSTQRIALNQLPTGQHHAYGSISASGSGN